MKKSLGKKGAYQNGKSNGGKSDGKKRSSLSKDSFFEPTEPKRRRKFEDEIIESSDDEEAFDSDGESDKGDVEKDEEIIETAAEKRKRLAYEHLASLREKEKRHQEEEDEFDVEEREKDGNRDSLIAKVLQQEQLEESGRLRKAIASRVKKPESSEGFRFLLKHRQCVTAVALSDDDSRGFSASKDGSIVHWDVETGKSEKYVWPSDNVLKSHGLKAPQGKATKHSKHVQALAVSSDGRYLASGGHDRHVHLWDVRTRGHIQAFPGHKGPVSCLTFRQGTCELFSGSYDRSIKIWNGEDRTYISTLFGHQSEVLTIDSLRKERVLTVGRDRTMHLWKVPEESQLIFRTSASSLECCCFISNDEFLSGSDDGTIEQWNLLRKKPVHIVKNAHPVISEHSVKSKDNGLANGHTEDVMPDSLKLGSSVLSWVNSVAVCRSSDIAASGAGNGSVRLWGIEDESKGIRPLFELPLDGFVNSLAFAKSARFLIAGVGKEPRLGRWGRIASATNGVAIHPLKLS